MNALELDRLRRSFHTGEIPVATPDCLPAETIAALADGTLPAERRAAALRHVATCALCRRAIASVAYALADGPVTHEIERAEGRARRFGWGRVGRITVPLAAAATILLLLRTPGNENGGHRGPPPAAALVPRPQEPLGVVATAKRLLWTHVDGADRYRVTLFDAGAQVLFAGMSPDTAVALADSVVLVPNRTYLWKVEARTGFDRWVSSELVQFSVAGDARR